MYRPSIQFSSVEARRLHGALDNRKVYPRTPAPRAVTHAMVPLAASTVHDNTIAPVEQVTKISGTTLANTCKGRKISSCGTKDTLAV